MANLHPLIIKIWNYPIHAHTIVTSTSARKPSLGPFVVVTDRSYGRQGINMPSKTDYFDMRGGVDVSCILCIPHFGCGRHFPPSRIPVWEQKLLYGMRIR